MARSRLDKLDIKHGQRVSVVGLDDEAFREEVAARAGEVSWGRAVEASDRVLVAVHAREDLDDAVALCRHMKRDGAMWILWPKGRQEIKRGDVFEAAHRAGLVDIKVASFSDVYSGLKFVVPLRDR